MKIKYRKLLKKAFGSRPVKPTIPLIEKSRMRWDEYDHGYEYGFIPLMNLSDEEIEEYLDENVRVKIMYSPYDCTGQMFTYRINWKRNPGGLISYVNHLGLDV